MNSLTRTLNRCWQTVTLWPKTAIIVTILAGLLVIALWPELFGLGPTVKNPVTPIERPGEIVGGPLGEHWNPGDDVPWRVVLPLAEISQAAYKQGDELRQSLKRWGFDRLEEIPPANDSMFACVASNEKALVIAFRGTDDIEDWLVNTRVLSDRVDHGTIHRGFYRSMQAMRPRILQAVKNMNGEKKQIWVVGHSLGGALALAFAYANIIDRSFEIAGLVTFGQPLVVNGALANYLNRELDKRYLRFVHEADVVTRVLPPYSHGGIMVWFHEGGFERKPPQMLFAAMRRHGDEEPAMAYEGAPEPLTNGEFQKLQRELARERNQRDRIRAQQTFGGNSKWIADHGMVNYIHWIVTLGKTNEVQGAQ